jgi:hypothetical protein
LRYHVGGFNRTIGNSSLQTKTDNFGSKKLHVKEGHSHAKIHWYVNAQEIFKGVEISELHTFHMPGAAAMAFASRFRNAIKVDHVH